MNERVPAPEDILHGLAIAGCRHAAPLSGWAVLWDALWWVEDACQRCSSVPLWVRP